MSETARPRRSLLFVPAGNARALEKSDGLAADGLIYDLEDSAAPGEKAAARERLREHLAAPGLAALGFPGERIVRINGLDTAWGTEDLLMARGAGVDAILLPKVESAEAVRQVAVALSEMDAPESLAIWAMIETPRGIRDVEAIAARCASQRLAALVVGPNDIALSTGIAPGEGRAELLPWLMRIVLGAKAEGLAVLDGVYADFRNLDGFASECRAGRRMGFDGKTLIHPGQIGPANEAFAPDPAAVAQARAVVEAFGRPENRDKGVIQIDGRMVERLHRTQAERLLAMDTALKEREKTA